MQILKTCGAACVMMQSWINLYHPVISMATSSLEPLEWDDRYRYQQCLIGLTKAFCRVLHRMNRSPTRIALLCCGRPHEALPFQKRNAELVAILIANLATISPVPGQVWLHAEGVCQTIACPSSFSITDNCARSFHLTLFELFNG